MDIRDPRIYNFIKISFALSTSIYTLGNLNEKCVEWFLYTAKTKALLATWIDIAKLYRQR